MFLPQCTLGKEWLALTEKISERLVLVTPYSTFFTIILLPCPHSAPLRSCGRAIMQRDKEVISCTCRRWDTQILTFWSTEQNQMALPRWWWSNYQATQPSRFHTEVLLSTHWLLCDAPLGPQVLAKSPECLQIHCDVLKKNCKVETYFLWIWSQQNSFSLQLFYFHPYLTYFATSPYYVTSTLN